MRILWLKTELLHPVDKGGKIRTYHMLKELKRDHAITYLTLDDGASNGDAANARQLASEYCHELICIPHQQRRKFTPGFYAELGLNLMSNLPYAIAKYQSAEMRRRISELTKTNAYDVIVCDFLAPAVNMPRDPGCPTVLFQHNVEAMIWKRHAEVQANLLKRTYLYGQWRQMQAFESVMCRRFDRVIAVSPEDCNQMQREYHVEAISDVPTGVDTNFFRPRRAEPRNPSNLVFTGSMDWLPNEDAIQYFTGQILPLIKQSIPNVTVTVVGRNPYPALLELSRRDPSVIVTGRVDDVRPYMERAAAYIVPLRIGGGTRLKIFEAMAMEKPLISTTVGAEGLPVRHESELLLADTPESFSAAVVRVFQDGEFAFHLGRRAAKLVREQFGWNRVAVRFAEICEQARHPTQGAATQASIELQTTL
ncbi:MAG TPA: glycosyltransferase [Pyrinomonadaceae bacterium]|nr:glycosyltransferase [Pyrinomonadaceae bacterium]